MSTTFQSASVTVFVADHASIDGSNKVNALGIGFTLVGMNPESGLSAPQDIVALFDFPGSAHGQQASFSLELRDVDANRVVSLPGPTGEPQAMRMQQVVRIERIAAQGVWVPDDVGCRVQMMLNFPNGLPLQVSRRYAWRAEVDGQHRQGWEARFYVPGPAPGPVIGGPSGPAPTDLPPIHDDSVTED